MQMRSRIMQVLLIAVLLSLIVFSISFTEKYIYSKKHSLDYISSQSEEGSNSGKEYSGKDHSGEEQSDYFTLANSVKKGANTFSINIRGNSEWLKAEKEEPWCYKIGDIYIIQDIRITSNGSIPCISIQDTDLPYLIRNCSCWNGTAGILLNNASYGVIRNSSCLHNKNGIQAINSTTISIESTKCTVNTWSGIQFNECENSLVEGCNSSENLFGIEIISSTNCSLKNNALYKNTYTGAAFTEGYNNLILKNVISNSSKGLGFYYEKNFIIHSNNITENRWGIVLSHCVNDSIFNNNFFGNEGNFFIPPECYYLSVPDITFLEAFLISPSSNKVHGITPPAFKFSYFSLHKYSTIWYTLNQGNNSSFNSMEGRINESEWRKVETGPVSLEFNANNSLGDVESKTILLHKDVKLKILPPLQDGNEYDYAAPTYNLSLLEYEKYDMWYSLNNGLNYSIKELVGNINQSAWWDLMPGEVIITFYYRNPYGEVNNEKVKVIIVNKFPENLISNESPKNDSPNLLENESFPPFVNMILINGIAIIVCLITACGVKKLFSEDNK